MNHQSLRAFVCASDGKLADLQRLELVAPGTLSLRDGHGYSLLHRACLNGHLETVQWLLEQVRARAGVRC